MRTTRTCPACGVVFARVHSATKAPIYCSRACANRAPGRMTPEIRSRIGRSGTDHPNFKGGWSAQGRARVLLPRDERHLHPTCSVNGYILRYHKVWNDAHPDDPVQRGEVIHHLNGDSSDDRIENLEKHHSQASHWLEHAAVIARNRSRDKRGRFV